MASAAFRLMCGGLLFAKAGVLLVRHPTVVYNHNVAYSNAISLLWTISISHISKHQAIASRLLQRNYTQVRCYRG